MGGIWVAIEGRKGLTRTDCRKLHTTAIVVRDSKSQLHCLRDNYSSRTKAYRDLAVDERFHYLLVSEARGPSERHVEACHVDLGNLLSEARSFHPSSSLDR